jgi:tetratricopeptide (TPR) repeat protein
MTNMRRCGDHLKTLSQPARQGRLALRFLVIFLASLVLAGVSLAQLNHIEVAANLLSQGQMGQAEAEARKALHNPSTRALALAMLGTIRLQEGKYKESTSFLTRALALNPRMAGARTSLGNAYLLQGKSDLARKSFQQALSIDPSNLNARFDLARVEASLQNYGKSLEVAGPIVPQLVKSEEGIFLLATDYGALEKTEELKRLASRWQDLQAPSDESSLDFANVLAKNAMTIEAKEVLEALETRISVHASSLTASRLGEAYLSLGLLERAEQNLQLALRLDSSCGTCNRNLAQVAERQGNTEKALVYLIKAKQQAPEDPEILFDFGKVCLQRNLLEDALPALAKAASLKPDRDPYVYVLASANVAKGNLPEAASLLGKLLRKHPQDSVLNYAMGTVFYLQGKYPEAESSLRQSLQAQPDQVASSYYLALTYDEIGQEDQAVAVFRSLVKNHPEHAPSYAKLGTILLRQHQYDEAQLDLERAVALDPGSVEAHYQLGLLLRRLGKLTESEEQFAESRKLEADRSGRADTRLRLLLPD